MAGPDSSLIVLGVLQVIIGILQPILWGLGFVFPGYYSAVAAPVWGGVIFFIPAGILGILAGKSKQRPIAIASLVMSILASIAAAIVIIATSIITAADFSFYYYSIGDVVVDFISILLGVMEGIVAIIAAVYSSRIASQATAGQMQAAATFTVAGAGPSVQQYPAQQFQGQYPGPYPAVQGQYPGPPAQEQYPRGPAAQGQYPPGQEEKD